MPVVRNVWTGADSPSFLPYSFMAPMTFFLSLTGGILSLSITMALTFLAPITAPTPPRAAMRDGRLSVSENVTPAIRPSYSPTGPQIPREVFSPYTECSLEAHSKLPKPIYGFASSKVIPCSLVIRMITHSSLAPCRVIPAICNCPIANPKVPPLLASLTPPVKGLLQPTLSLFALEKLVPANGPTEKINGFSGASGSTSAIFCSSSILAIK